MKKLSNKILKSFFGETKIHLIKAFIFQTLVVVLNFIIGVIIARQFSKETYGIYTFFISITGILILISIFGLNTNISKQISKDNKIERVWLKKSNQFLLIWTTLTLIVSMLTFKIFDILPNLKYFAWLIVFCVVIKVNYRFLQGLIRGRKLFVLSYTFDILGRILVIISLWFIILLKQEITALLLTEVISFTLLLIAIYYYISKKEFIQEKITETPNYKLIIFASLPFLWQSLSFHSLFHIDRIMLGTIASFSELGQFNAVSNITNTIRLIASVFPIVLVPMAVHKKFKITKSISLIILLLIPLILFISILAYFIVPIIFGPDFKTEIYLPFMLSISSGFLVLYSFISSVILGSKKDNKQLRKVFFIDAFFLSVCLNIILNYIFILKFGIIGAPVATTIVLLTKIIYLIRVFSKTKEQKNKEVIQ